MDEARARKLIDAVIAGSTTLGSIAETAVSNRKSLRGAGFYAEKFHDAVVKFSALQRALVPILASVEGFDAAALINHFATLTSPTASLSARDVARKQVRLVLEADIIPRLEDISAPAHPSAELVLPAAVLAKAPTYLQRTLLQANGCYEQRWFDACSVMIRKLVETLIIDVYEKHGREAEIKKDGNYQMLANLVTSMLNQTHWQLQRETKRELPQIKTLGDRAAHNRRYQAIRQDIDQIRAGLRATVDDLLHLAGHK
jgi:hypothetical protein